MLTDLRPANGQQAFEPCRYRHEEQDIAILVDQVHKKVGKEMLGLGVGGIRPGPQ